MSLRWSDNEAGRVARRHIAMHGDKEATIHTLQIAQLVLPQDRQHAEVEYGLCYRLRRVLRDMSPADREAAMMQLGAESTTALREHGVMDRRNGHADFYAEPAPTSAPSPPPAIRPPQVIASRPVNGAASNHTHDHADIELIIDPLIGINRLIIELSNIKPEILCKASSLQAKRIQSLIIQASNGLTFFEELATIARRY